MDAGLIARLSEISEEEARILQGGGVDMQLYNEKRRKSVEASKFLEGKLISIRTHTRFAPFPPHRHQFIEIMYVCQGAITHVVGDEEITLHAGELLFLGCNSWHEIRAAGERDIGVNFLIRPAFFRAAFDMMDGQNALSDFIIDSLSGEGSADEYLHFAVADVLPVQNLVENLIWSLYNGESGSEKLNEMTMGILFLQLMQAPDLARAGGGAPRQVALRALSYIEAHYIDATLREFAARNGLAEYTVSRMIKGELGTSFRILLMEKRFSAAVHLLNTTELPVSEVIASVGYGNTSYFYRTFQQKHGCTPQEYRRRREEV